MILKTTMGITGLWHPSDARGVRKTTMGITMACGSRASEKTLLFDPSMSALPIIAMQNSPSVGLFTR